MKISKDTKSWLGVIVFIVVLSIILWLISCKKSSPDCDIDNTGAIELANKVPYPKYFEVISVKSGYKYAICLDPGKSITHIMPTGTAIVYTTDENGYNARPQQWDQETIRISKCNTYPFAKYN